MLEFECGTMAAGEPQVAVSVGDFTPFEQNNGAVQCDPINFAEQADIDVAIEETDAVYANQVRWAFSLSCSFWYTTTDFQFLWYHLKCL